tara:strand:+ start:6592 stop:6999 length:408 start_codon:yes stop_codon:yes gene_type:complete
VKYLSRQGFIMPDFKEITFDEFYKLYPRKVGRFMANKSFKKLSRRDKMLAYDGLLNYIKFWEHNKTEKQFIPHPSTWINQRRWEDEIELPKTKEQKSKNIDEEVIAFRKQQQKLLEDSADESDIKDALSGFLGRK